MTSLHPNLGIVRQINALLGENMFTAELYFSSYWSLYKKVKASCKIDASN